MSMPSDNYRQFSVILRPKTGNPCSLSTYEIVMEIRNRLAKYKGIFNVAVSLPNFIVHLNTLQQQLHVLSLKEFSGPGYTLEIKPWTSDYISLQLPWLVDHKTEGSSSVSDKVHVNIPETMQQMVPVIDFSYLMILELKDHYYSKLHAFLKCEETCKHLYDIARPFSKDMEPRITAIYKQTERYSSIPPTEILAAVPDFGASLNYQQLFIDEEIFGLYMTMDSIYRTRENPLCLNMYQNQQADEQMMSPTQSKELLKFIFEVVVQSLYPGAETTSVHLESDDCICTTISSETFRHRYKLAKPATQGEAEAAAYYRFLKYVTNVLGYHVVDQNWWMLKQIVASVQKYTHLISDLQYCVNTVSNMISSVETNVKDMYKRLLDEVPAEKIPHLSTNIDSLISLIQDYNAAAQHLLNNFEEEKKCFHSIKFASLYSPASDEA